ncbi:uncharacterized protein LOC116986997 [Amblyraja radiata]|uniref:uncharacterized protein LOC116986997 n=1 Tax=Amblyraja radiata TaxID=386614 RepID=UPI0014039F03|nr:uncharacterized protein LOC116986997 [Amblyraja radiata]
MDETMWIPILLISSLPVSGAVWGEEYVRGVVGRAITTDCHYAPEYRSHTKYWCRESCRLSTIVAETNGQPGRSGRVSITDHPARGIFTVAVEDLHSGDTGWYSCGMTTSAGRRMFSVHLEVSDEPVSVPVLGFLSPANVSCLGGSVSVSCDSVQGSLPISYSWYEKTPSGDSKISDNNTLDLHCQSFKHQHHQYYCTASNRRGSNSSEMVNVSISSSDVPCSFVVKINGTVSDAVWGEGDIRGVVGRAITIDCHYAAEYRSQTKYWCRGRSLQCTVLVETNGQHGRSGRVSITDNPARGTFTVTVEDLHTGDTGWYRCGITTSAAHPMFIVHLRVSDEPVSAPALRYLSPANASRLGGSVSVSCESVRGSLPIHYTWCEKKEHGCSTILSGNQLDLSCEILGGQHRQYYCTASNNRGTKSSEILNVKVFKGAGTCSYVTEMNNTVSGALWAESEVRGVVGRAITIDCHYAAVYRSQTKYWCREISRQCTHVVETNGKHGQNGRVSFTDNPARGIFTVTVEDLQSGDTGWYRCGITTPGEPTFKVHLQVSEEPVSVPVLVFLSPANVSCFGGSVSVSCESVRGSLPITYTWYEKTPTGNSKILDNNDLDLHCQSFKHQHHQYSCTASNKRGSKSSEIVNVTISSSDVPCSFPVKINGTVSGELWGQGDIRGVVGRAITIDCHYAAENLTHTKYWCRGRSRQCTVLVKTNGLHGRSGRVSITDNPARGTFTVTVEDLHSGDTGWYRCGITTSAAHPTFIVQLQVSDEPVSAPVLRYLSPANASRPGGSVSVSCESVRGSLPIHYTWFEKNEHGWSTILYDNQLDLSCEILGGQHRQYYCTAANTRGTNPSEILNVKVFKGAATCSYVTEMNNAVSGALWAESEVRGVVGRAITIDCHYAAMYRSHTKYWCPGIRRQCTHVVETNEKYGQNGRVSITDNPARGIFTVTVEDLHSGDTGWYRCGITAPGEPTFQVHLQVSEEPVSVPVLVFLSPANVSCFGGSVSVSCESVRGSLPITYTWYEKTPSGNSKISDNNALDLHCQSFKHQHHQYSCTASNKRGSKSSEMVNVSISSIDVPCSFPVKINGTVSGEVWGQGDIRGVVGRAITIDCHYAAENRSHAKYWCRGRSRQCTVLVKTNGLHGRSGRVSITDNPARGTFTVTVEDLHSGDTGWYRCGITTSATHPTFIVQLQVSDEHVSAPALRYLSPANASRLGGSVSVSCESVRGSLPIHYTWFEKNEHGWSTILYENQLDLSCEILGGQHRQYYCTAANTRGTKPSEILNVKVFKGAATCSYVTEMNNTVSGALWAESEVRGVVGRAITIDCHYAAVYRSHTKYWCPGISRQCTHVVETNEKYGQNGRVSITDNPARGIFTVTVEDLHSGDTGWYRCGITATGEPTFQVHLQVSEEPVSVPVLVFLSPANVSCFGGSVSVSCESVRGSLPITYTWYEKTPSGNSKISDNNALDLHCQSFKHQHHQYSCTASNKRGSKSSEMVNVSISSIDVPCSFPVKINGTVSGEVWGQGDIRGVVGRAITIDCHYAAENRSHTKYWCRGRSRQCTVLVKTNGLHGRSGRVSITDNPARGTFTVTVEDLHSGDTGWYRCGITTSAALPTFIVQLQVSDEHVSAPVLRYLSPANASRLGGSVSVSCESVRGSLPIHYTWFEKNEHGWSTILYDNQLDLSCEILGGQHRQYYCTAANTHGTNPSEILNVKVFKGAATCSYVTEMNYTVSGALWAESEVRGVVGRAITIDCHYAAVYRSHTKYWCPGTSRQCTHVVETNGKYGQNGSVSITDNPARGIFTVTVEDLHSGDTGWYRFGITAPGEPTFQVHLQVSEEPVSVPVLVFLSPANVSCFGDSVSVSCESVRGSLPINYIWYEKTPSANSKISDNNALDLHCQSFKHQHRQYYCTASNKRGAKSSEMVNVSISSSDVPCSFPVKINGTGHEYSCGKSITSNYSASYISWKVGRWMFFLLLVIWSISTAVFTRGSKRRDDTEPRHSTNELQ